LPNYDTMPIFAIGYIRFTSIRDIESVATTFRFGSKPVNCIEL